MVKCWILFNLGKIIKSYLSERTYFINLNSHITDVKEISAWEPPQGYLLWHILYSFSTHDIPKSWKTLVQMFADYTIIFTPSVCERDTCIRIQDLLDLLNEYNSK